MPKWHPRDSFSLTNKRNNPSAELGLISIGFLNKLSVERLWSLFLFFQRLGRPRQLVFWGGLVFIVLCSLETDGHWDIKISEIYFLILPLINVEALLTEQQWSLWYTSYAHNKVPSWKKWSQIRPSASLGEVQLSHKENRWGPGTMTIFYRAGL
jgi:hypothetical protein